MTGRSLLIRGPAGSGKTEYCLRVCWQALEKSRPGTVVFLVPGAEAVRDTERRLLQGGSRRGLSGPVVTDFTSLARRVLNDGGEFPLRYVDVLQKRYVLLGILQDVPLTFFKDVRRYEGFLDVAAAFIAELKRGMISPERFLQACLPVTGRGPIAEEKVRELYAIYDAYQQGLKGRGAYDAEGLLWKSAELLSDHSSLFSEVELLVVDGFATYTPVEFKVLTALVGRARQSHVTLCYEENREDVFAFVEGTYRRLKTVCSGGEVVLKGNHRASGSLLHLERTLFSEATEEVSADKSLVILPQSDPYREMEGVARQIERIRREDGLEYADFLIIFRDVGDSLPFVSEVLGERGIPYSLPLQQTLGQEPFVRVVLAVLELVNGTFSRGRLLTVLKSSYWRSHMDVAAALENYANEYGLWEEELFRQPWTQPGQTIEDVTSLNDFKALFLGKLDRLRSRAQEVESAEDFRQLVLDATAEFEFLSGGGAIEEVGDSPLSGWGRAAPRLFPEYRSLAGLSRLLDNIADCARLADWPRADYGVFLEVLKRGLSWMPACSLPRNRDSVRITSIVGGPLPEAAVVFVCGLCERSFPREIISEPFFKDRERRLVNRRGGIALDERLLLSSGERFFFYIAMSRATGRLILTYPATDGKGNELIRSHYVEEVVRRLSHLPELPTEEVPGRRVVPEFSLVADCGELRSFVAQHLSVPVRETPQAGDENSIITALAYNELLRRGHFGAEDLLYSAATEELSEEACGDLREKDAYYTSVSELETFARCPFRHFCEYRLGLKEPPQYEFGPVEEGMLYHEALARLYRKVYNPEPPSLENGAAPLASHRTGVESFSAEELEEKLRQLSDDFISERYERLFRSPRMDVRRRALQARMRDFLLKEVENERANATRPSYFELSFGRGRSQQGADARSIEGALSIEEGGHPAVRISGRIDRVDVFEREQERFGVVVDYKRSARVSRSGLHQGIVLQPGIYLLALEELFRLRAAGAFYYSISSGRKRGIFAKEEEGSISGQGDVSRVDKATFDEIRELMKLNAQQAVEIVQRIVDGEIAIRPADIKECRNCPFSSICRIKDQRSFS